MKRTLPYLVMFALSIALAPVLTGCGKSCGGEAPKVDAPSAPEAPKMPAGWTVKNDTLLPRSEFWREEQRLEGKLKAFRKTTYDVKGKVVELHVIVPKDTAEADKMFRILANKKAPWSFVRKGEVLYEFAGPNEAAEEIQAAQATLK